ncbi:hypothetical protein RQP46_007006 [Phenoliferia psychrophenolica]
MSNPPPPPAPAVPPPRPPTGGAGPSASSGQGRYRRLAASRPFRIAATGWAWKRVILLGVGTTYGLVEWQRNKIKAARRDAVKDKTWLHWKIYDGGIVEAKSTGSSLNYLLTSSGGTPEEPPRVMTLFEVIRAIKFIEADPRIRGIIADFSATSIPAVPSYSLGLAQLEEIQDALLELRRTKQEKLGTGPDGWRSVAWTDSFNSQGQFLFASCFDEVYTQPTGEVPLVGIGTTQPFFGRLLNWLGIRVHAEARSEYKSFVQPYIDEKLTEPQRENQKELINDLNDNLMTYIARNRFPDEGGQAGLDKVKELSQVGPFTNARAVKEGLLDGATYRQDILDSVFEEDKGGDSERTLMGFYHYAKVMEKAVEKTKTGVIDVGVVYLLGTIGDSGEFGTAAVVKGLKEAGDDETIGAVVLRIDSGGGGVVESDTIWAAVRDLRAKGKVCVASFANASASGGYLVSTHVDAILAAPSTITGSIGVASLRPTFLPAFFDRLKITLDSYYSGTRAQDVTHELTPAELARHAESVDGMYDDFKNRVCEGRGIHPEVIDKIAGGRVMTGLKAFSLNAPESLIRQIKGLDTPARKKPLAEVTSGEESAPKADSVDVATSPIEEGELKVPNVVTISEDQETSPFAPPEPSIPSVLPVLEHAESLDPEAHASEALATATPEDLNAPTTPPSGIYPIVLGPFGRGLIDGIGGIRDAAIYSTELFIANGLAGYKEDHPEATDDEAIATLLGPNSTFERGPNGETLMQVDVRLKRFPAQKSFWAQLGEATKRGDSIDPAAVAHYLKVSAAQYLLRVAAGVVSSEMEDLGLGNARAGLGLGSARQKSWMRAEWKGLNLR